MKEQYDVPQMEVILLQEEDIIMTSPEDENPFGTSTILGM